MPQAAELSVKIKMAAEQGFAGAQFNLAVMHDKGQGVGQNYAEAENSLAIKGLYYESSLPTAILFGWLQDYSPEGKISSYLSN